MVTEIGNDILKAASILKDGGLVAIPTETVYGLAGNALNNEAVHSIFRVKERPLGNPLIIHLHDRSQLKEYVTELPETAIRLMDRFSPGPLTYLLPRSEKITDLITAGSPLVAVRFPDHTTTRQLLQQLDFPLAAPSANKYTRISPTTAEHVFKQLNGEIPYILDGGPCEKGIESTVIGFVNGNVIMYRHGMITEEDLRSEGVIVKPHDKTSRLAHSPGLSAVHYSPKTPLLLCSNIEDELANHDLSTTAIISFYKRYAKVASDRQFILSESGHPEEAATKLYAALHLMDESGAKVILAEKLPDYGIGKAINDRLIRAAKKII